MYRCAYWILACATLHNLLLEDPVDTEWMEANDEDVDEDVDDENQWERVSGRVGTR